MPIELDQLAARDQAGLEADRPAGADMPGSANDFEMNTEDLIRRLALLAGGDEQARVWYQTRPIPAFGSCTANELVLAGQWEAVDQYIAHLELGGFA